MFSEKSIKKKGPSKDGPVFIALSVAGVGHKSKMTSALDSCCELSLMSSAGASNTAGENLCSFGCVLAKLVNILIIDAFYLINAE